MSGLVPVSALPAAMRGLFPYEHLNRMQSEVFEYAFGSDASLVVSSPTGSGKTAVLDLALARMWTLRDWPAGSKPVAVYMAPLKAITHERSTDWQAKLTPLGLRCCELTGDTGNSPADLAALRDADLIVTTPEKWDAVTRSRSDGQSMISRVALFLIDEIHLLAEEGRGPTLEAVVARMKLISLSEMLGDTPLRWLRFVAISATIANIDDIARWLHPQCAVATFDSSYRPVPLQWHVEAHDMRITYTFDAQLASRLWPVVRKHSGGRPALVFCNSRKTADLAAQASLTRSSPNSARPGFPRVFSLASPSHFAPPPPPPPPRPANIREQQVSLASVGALLPPNSPGAQYLSHVARSKIQDGKLAELLKRGVAFYHAGLSVADRRALEKLFSEGALPILCSTSGLAQGVNLPAHLVVILNTAHYAKGGFTEYTRTEILQMAGRAGRPQFDTSGTCVVMTRSQMRQLDSPLVIEPSHSPPTRHADP